MNTAIRIGVLLVPCCAFASAAWAAGEPLHQTLDAYNNGLLCAPHRK